MYNVLNKNKLSEQPIFCATFEEAQEVAKQKGPSALIHDLRPQYARNLIEGIISGELPCDTAAQRDLKSRIKMFGCPERDYLVKDWAQRLGYENQTELELLIQIFSAWSH